MVYLISKILLIDFNCFFSVLEEECYNSLASLVSSKRLVFVTQTKLLYEVTWKTVMAISQKYVVCIYLTIDLIKTGLVI